MLMLAIAIKKLWQITPHLTDIKDSSNSATLTMKEGANSKVISERDLAGIF